MLEVCGLKHETEDKPKDEEGTRKMVICISGMTACGKSTVSRRLAKRYGLEYRSGGTMLKEMAIKEGYAPRGKDWWESEEGKSFFMKRKEDGGYDRRVDQMLIKRAKRGGVILDSWTMPWLLEGGLKIWIDSPPDERARRLSKRDKISYKDAYRILKEKDEATRAIFKRLYGFDIGEDFTPFHIILDNRNLSSHQTYEVLRELTDHILFKSSRND